MRKLLYYLMILIIPFLTGCNVGVGIGIGIGGWGWCGSGWCPSAGANVFFNPTFDRSTLTPQDITRINNMKNSAQQSGYTVVDTSTPDTISFKASKHIDNLANNDVDGLPEFVTKEGSRYITVSNDGSKDYYKIRAVVDLTKNQQMTKAAHFTAPSSSKISLKMDLPTDTTYTNANQKTNNGKTLEWNLIPGKKNLIAADFAIDRNSLNKQ